MEEETGVETSNALLKQYVARSTRCHDAMFKTISQIFLALGPASSIKPVIDGEVCTFSAAAATRYSSILPKRNISYSLVYGLPLSHSADVLERIVEILVISFISKLTSARLQSPCSVSTFIQETLAISTMRLRLCNTAITVYFSIACKSSD